MRSELIEVLNEVSGRGGLKDSEYVEGIFVSNPVTVSCAFGDLVDLGDQERSVPAKSIVTFRVSVGSNASTLVS